MGIRLGGGAEISSKSGLNFSTLSLQFTTHCWNINYSREGGREGEGGGRTVDSHSMLSNTTQ